MTVLVDFLPAAWRERQRQRQRTKKRLLMLIPVATSLLATDLVLRQRVHIAQEMIENARAHEMRAEQAATQLRQQASRLASRQATIEHDLQPLQVPRMITLLDAIVAGMPAGTVLNEVTLRHEPWSTTARPTVAIQASTASSAQFERFLAALGIESALPQLHCTRTFRTSSGVGFQLDSTTVPAGPR